MANAFDQAGKAILSVCNCYRSADMVLVDMVSIVFWKMGDYFVQHLLGDNTPPPVDIDGDVADKPKDKLDFIWKS